jgi:hypothetical protein
MSNQLSISDHSGTVETGSRGARIALIIAILAVVGFAVYLGLT